MTQWGDASQWQLSKAALAQQRKLQQSAKKAEEAAKEASRAAKAAKEQAQAATKTPTKGKGKGKGKGAGKGGANNGNSSAASGNPATWTCQDPDCLADLRKHNKTRGACMNPAGAAVCKHCLAPKDMGQKMKSAEMEASRSTLREKITAKLKNSQDQGGPRLPKHQPR